MNNYRVALATAAFSAFACFSSSSQAEMNVAIVPYAEAGISNYSLDFDGPSELDGIDINYSEVFFNFASIKLGLGVTFDRFYVNGYYRTTDETDGTQDPVLSGAPSIRWTGEREAYSLAGGYSFENGFSVFGGYRDSETSGNGSDNSTQSFSHDGFTMGGSYRLGLTDTGGLTFTLGYAWLDVEIDYSPYGLPVPGGEGDGSGVKLSLVWGDFFNESWGYTVGLEYYNYDFELDLDVAAGLDNNLDMEESEVSFMLGLRYVF